MSDSPEVSVLIHELGGMLSSVQGFAHIAASNPDHPDRERFIGLAASEARRAAQALKDLHLVRALDRGAIAVSPPPAELGALLTAAAKEGSIADLPAHDDGLTVAVDFSKTAGPLGRCWARAVAPVAVAVSDDHVVIDVPLAPAADLARRAASLEAPYPDMVLCSVLRRLLRLWGGDVAVAAPGEWTVASLRLPRAR